MSSPTTTLDIASGPFGGAARFVGELDRYLGSHPRQDLAVIGRDRRLTPLWLARRELLARSSHRRIAINNASFVKGSDNTVLLRNALHFASDDEIKSLGIGVSAPLRAQAHLVRRLASQADSVITPCTAMAERVAHYIPGPTDRIKVKFHPVTMPMRRDPDPRPTIFVPIVNAPYKQLSRHFSLLKEALEYRGDTQTSVYTTTNAEQFPYPIAKDARFKFIGVKTADDLKCLWTRATAVYFPTHLESFGYALAEARCLGMPVIAPDTEQNREIAAAALSPYTPGDMRSLADAVERALTIRTAPDPQPFDARTYFDSLMHGARK